MAANRDTLMFDLVDTQLTLAALIRRVAQHGNMELALKLTYVWKWLDSEIKRLPQ